MSKQCTCGSMSMCACMHMHTSGGRREHSQVERAIWMAEWGQETKTFITSALLAHITSILRNGHGSTALYNAKMQNLKSLLLGFNLMTQLFISEHQASEQALYMVALFSTFMLEELCLGNWTVPPVSDDKRLWTGTLRGFRPRYLHPVRTGNKHPVPQLCQFSASSHLGSFMLPTQPVLCEF